MGAAGKQSRGFFLALRLLCFIPLSPCLALGLPVVGRILASAAMIFPLEFLLGMPPLGILAITDQPRAPSPGLGATQVAIIGAVPNGVSMLSEESAAGSLQRSKR
jgi:hypothetical protein